VKSCLIDGEAIVCDANGLAVFDLLRRRWHGEDVIRCAFDLLEIDGKDMRGGCRSKSARRRWRSCCAGRLTE
jgi:ATP-dependent DNA ligase